MNSNKILVAGIVGAVVAFILGWLIWGMALAGVDMGIPDGIMRSDEEMQFLPLAIGHLGFGFLLAIVFGRWASISTFSTGAKAGAMIGFLFTFATDLILLGTTHLMNTTGAIIDIVAATVSMAITGGVVAWWLGRD